MRKLTKEDIISKTLECEGGYANLKGDRGGETYCGIARNFFPSWSGWKIIDQHKPLKSNQKINDSTLNKLVIDFYDQKFYIPSKCSQFVSDRVAMHTYDMGVNAGQKASNKILQQAINKTYSVNISVDGVVGPTTIGYANKVDKLKELETNVSKCRIEYYSKLKSANLFLKGWTSRVNNLDSWLTKKGC